MNGGDLNVNRIVVRRVRRLSGVEGRGLFVILALAGLAAAPASVPAQTTGFLSRTYRDDAGEHRYAVFLPRDYARRADWPVILFLHGASERGTDGRKPLTVGLGPIVEARLETFPFVAVFPQCEDVEGRALTGWNAGTPDGERALAILDQVLADFRTDRRRVILTGWSMGGFGAWSLAAAHPERFHSVVPVSGGGDPDDAAPLARVPVWAFHGSNDRAVPVAEARAMIEAVKAAGGQPRYTEVDRAGHDVWRHVYGGDALYRWMLDPSASIPEFYTIRPAPGSQPSLAGGQTRFVPALELSRAVTLRLGNDALDAIATSVPRVVRPDTLQGRIADIADRTTASGRTFNVWFTNISYRGDLVRAEAGTRGPEGLDVALGVRNAVLTIGTTYVRGGSRSAVAGPIQIVIGHRSPVWLTMIARPRVDGGRVRLQLLNSRFDIPDGNWYVTAPAGISTRGLFFTRERVSRELVNGLYGSKARIEREVTAIIPAMLAQLEQQIDVTEVGRLVDGFWPLPVYQPQIRVSPASVSTDADGLTLVLNVVAGAVDPAQAPRTPRRIDVSSGNPGLNGTDLQVGLAPHVLSPLTQMLIDANVARIHVQDIPGHGFEAFADPGRLSAALPELARFGDGVELRSELSLAAPLQVAAATERAASLAADEAAGPTSRIRARAGDAGDASGRGRMTFEIPRAVIAIATRDSREARWQPLAECEFRLVQEARVVIADPRAGSRGLSVQWTGEPQVEATGRFASGYEPQVSEIDRDALRQLFVEAWNTWTHSGPASETLVPDVDLGYARLRLASADVLPGHVQLTFAEPGIRITNATDRTVTYQTQGATKPWGGPFRLEAGGSHQFDVAYPLLFRQTGGGFGTFTLPVGSEFEFRAPAPGGGPKLFLLP
jgi:dienelactone hydrolase